jgi:hypothetical protein
MDSGDIAESFFIDSLQGGASTIRNAIVFSLHGSVCHGLS